MSPPQDIGDQALIGAAQPSAAGGDYKNVGGAPSTPRDLKQWDGTAWNELADFPRDTDFGVGSKGTGGGTDMMAANTSYSYVYTFSSDSWSSDFAISFNGINMAGGSGPDDTNLICWRGSSQGTDRNTDTAEFNGSSWSKVGDLNVALNMCAGCGSPDDAISNGGLRVYYLTTTDLSELWDGSSDTWASTTDFPASMYAMSEAGTSIDAIATGGNAYVTSTYTLAGTTWSSGTASPVGAYGHGGSGSDSTNMLTCGGSTAPGPQYTDDANVWDNTSWSAITDLPVAQYGGYGSGVPP